MTKVGQPFFPHGCLFVCHGQNDKMSWWIENYGDDSDSDDEKLDSQSNLMMMIMMKRTHFTIFLVMVKGMKRIPSHLSNLMMMV